jgi:hydroxyethylthiazole kinase-like uncharacterized protein yjeF
MRVCSVEQMRALDRRAVEEHRIPEPILMENAGLAAAAVVRARFGVRGRRFAVVCGTGNNGGDGLVVARRLHSEGGAVRVLVVGDPQRYGPTSRANFEMVLAAGIEVVADASPAQVGEALAWCEVAVDGLLGTGLQRDVGGAMREVIEALNASGRPVLSLDIPSGVDGDSGAVRGVAVRAEATVTFGLPKLGNLLFPGAELGGELHVCHISYPPALQGSSELAVALNAPPPLPPRPRDGHKGSFGDALFVAGAASYYGAPSLAALSMLRSGGGYARLAAPRSVTPVVAALASEVVLAPQEETATGSLALSSYDRLLELAGAVDFVVLGPGLSLHDETQELVRRLAAEIPRPLLLDGDGLTAVAADLDVLRRRRAPTVLTPHLGEMTRLVGLAAAEIRRDPVGVLQRACRDLDAVVVLKGAHSLVGLPDGQVRVNLSGNPGMASAGVGDVLTGAVAAMHGLGLALEDAVGAGVLLHGAAGDLAARARGEDGITARDLLDHLPEAVRAYRERHAGLLAEYALEVV